MFDSGADFNKQESVIAKEDHPHLRAEVSQQQWELPELMHSLQAKPWRCGIAFHITH